MKSGKIKRCASLTTKLTLLLQNILLTQGLNYMRWELTDTMCFIALVAESAAALIRAWGVEAGCIQVALG